MSNIGEVAQGIFTRITNTRSIVHDYRKTNTGCRAKGCRSHMDVIGYFMYNSVEPTCKLDVYRCRSHKCRETYVHNEARC